MTWPSRPRLRLTPKEKGSPLQPADLRTYNLAPCMADLAPAYDPALPPKDTGPAPRPPQPYRAPWQSYRPPTQPYRHPTAEQQRSQASQPARQALAPRDLGSPPFPTAAQRYLAGLPRERAVTTQNNPALLAAAQRFQAAGQASVQSDQDRPQPQSVSRTRRRLLASPPSSPRALPAPAAPPVPLLQLPEYSARPDSYARVTKQLLAQSKPELYGHENNENIDTINRQRDIMQAADSQLQQAQPARAPSAEFALSARSDNRYPDTSSYRLFATPKVRTSCALQLTGCLWHAPPC